MCIERKQPKIKAFRVVNLDPVRPSSNARLANVALSGSKQTLDILKIQ